MTMGDNVENKGTLGVTDSLSAPQIHPLALALCTAFAPPLLFPTTPLAVRACAKGCKWAVLKRFRAVFLKPFPTLRLTLSPLKPQSPWGVYLYWLRATPR